MTSCCAAAVRRRPISSMEAVQCNPSVTKECVGRMIPGQPQHELRCTNCRLCSCRGLSICDDRRRVPNLTALPKSRGDPRELTHARILQPANSSASNHTINCRWLRPHTGPPLASFEVLELETRSLWIFQLLVIPQSVIPEFIDTLAPKPLPRLSTK
jgi:hypothetical protein